MARCRKLASAARWERPTSEIAPKQSNSSRPDHLAAIAMGSSLASSMFNE